MKYFLIDTSIDAKMLNDFMLFSNQNNEDDWTIVLESPGGIIGLAKSLLHIINNHKKPVTIICIDAYSAAFELFYYAKCEKILYKQSKGMVHLYWSDLHIMTNEKFKDQEHAALMKNWKQNHPNKQLAKKVLSSEEYHRYMKGEDVYLSFRRMKEIFPEAKII